MHFLGAVIAEKQDDIYGILAEWSEYADVDEYVKETRSEIITNGRADDQAYLEDHGNDTTTATVLNELERNTGRKVWWLNFHD